ncbi:MAG: hypothetical protein IAI49_08305, partial [Candidatus Eremiobacteraeota bacterium]|nr:hypothetical protein [Candidatus Eremiobacteraeota bacterium]
MFERSLPFLTFVLFVLAASAVMVERGDFGRLRYGVIDAGIFGVLCVLTWIATIGIDSARRAVPRAPR